MAASITVHLQIFKRPQLLCYSTDLDKIDIQIHGLYRSFKLNIVIIMVAVPFDIQIKQVAQWATIAHNGASIMFGDIIIYDAQRQITLNLKQ